jgi:putative SOS response-associated peptidase YedK
MCFNFANFLEAQKLESKFKAKFPEYIKYDPVYYVNGFSKPDMPVITDEGPDTINVFKWGLIPSWIKNEKDAEDISTKTLNARSESIFEKASFKHSIKNKRCLIPATGFFEWMHFKNKTYPHYIFLKDRDVFSLAGIWSKWTNKENGEMINSFSIITTNANTMMARIHNKKKRMPVILSQDDEEKWLDNQTSQNVINQLMQPYADREMDAYTISRLITSRTEARNVKEVIEKFEYPELN